MNWQSQNKIYYLGSPQSAQYIPNSALKNRKKQNFLVEFPQGDDYFGSSRKKQYAGLHHQSEIKATGLFDQYSNNYQHGTYEVADIEGAVPDSLMSQAVKNRMKGYFKGHDHSRKNPHPQYNYESINNSEESEYAMQQRQQKRHHESDSKNNYHFSRVRHIQTQPAQTTSKPIMQPVTFKPSEPRKIPEWIQTESPRIKQLEQQLFENQQNRLKIKRQANHRNSQNTIINHSQKKIQHNVAEGQYFQNDDRFTSLKRSREQIRQMWHGDNHKIMLFPQRQIRKLNPTYLSTQNYSNGGIPATLFQN